MAAMYIWTFTFLYNLLFLNPNLSHCLRAVAFFLPCTCLFYLYSAACCCC